MCGVVHTVSQHSLMGSGPSGHRSDLFDNAPLPMSAPSLTPLPNKLYTFTSLSQGPLVGERELRLRVPNIAIRDVWRNLEPVL